MENKALYPFSMKRHFMPKGPVWFNIWQDQKELISSGYEHSSREEAIDWAKNTVRRKLIYRIKVIPKFLTGH